MPKDGPTVYSAVHLHHVTSSEDVKRMRHTCKGATADSICKDCYDRYRVFGWHIPENLAYNEKHDVQFVD